jgi:hypothetical protein
MRSGTGCGLLLVLLLIGAGPPPQARAEVCFDAFDPTCRGPDVGPGRDFRALRSSTVDFHSRELVARRHAPLRGTGFVPLDALLSGLRLDRIDVSGEVDRRERPKRRGLKAPGSSAFVMLGVRATFGAGLMTEIWCELGGMEVLDHAVVVDGAFRPFSF